MSCKARQALGAAAAGQHAELHFGLAEMRMRRGDAERAGQGRFEAAAEGEAIDRGDHRLTQVFDQVEGRLGGPARRFGLDRRGPGELADVRAGRKGLVAGAGEDDAAYRGIVARILKGGAQVGQSQPVERVEHRRTIEGHISDPLVLLVQHVLERGRGVAGRSSGRKRSHDLVS
jgi:hypothetical protein